MAMAPIGPTQPEAGVMAARPAVPAVMCMTMPPAKSKTPIVLKKPASPQTIWVIGM